MAVLSSEQYQDYIRMPRRIETLQEELRLVDGLNDENAAKRRAAEDEVRRLRDLLATYGRHQEGCTGQWPEYRCRCGWRDVEREFTKVSSQ